METTEETVNEYTLEIDYIYTKVDDSSGGGKDTTTQYRNSYQISTVSDLPLDNRDISFEVVKPKKEELINDTQDLNMPERLRNKDIIKVIVEDITPIKEQQQRIFLIVLGAVFVLVVLLLFGVYIVFR